MISYHPHIKKIHIKKIVVFGKFKNSKYNFKTFKFQESFVKCKLVIMCMTYEQSCDL
jgi:hypothetical protein